MPSSPFAFAFGVYVIEPSAFRTTAPMRGWDVIVTMAPAGTGAPFTVSLASGLNTSGVAQLVAGVALQSSYIVYASLLARGTGPPPAAPTAVCTSMSLL